MATLKIRKIGNSLGVVIPKDLLDEMKLGEGDSFYATRAKNGLHLSPTDAEFARQMEIAEEIMERYKNTLRELAK